MTLDPRAVAAGAAFSLAACYAAEPPRRVYYAEPAPPPPRFAQPAAEPESMPPPPMVRRRPAPPIQRAPEEAPPPPDLERPAQPSGAPLPPGAPESCVDASPTAVPDCTILRPSEAACGSTALAQRCAAYRTYFDPKVFSLAVACLKALPGRQACDSAQAANCAHTALGQACPDSEVRRVCNVAQSSCGSSLEDCSALLSGLNDQGKEQVAKCIAQGCQGGLSACVDALK